MRVRWFRWALAGLAVVLALGGYVASVRWRARQDYREAVARFPGSPAEAELLAERAIQNAGGNYPEAQLLQCRALAATEQWEAALGGFSLIRDPSRCNASELVELGEAALRARQWKLSEMVLEAAAGLAGPAGARGKELLTGLDLQSRRPEDALRRCETWSRQSPTDPVPWAIAGDVHRLLYRFGEAIASYDQALQRSVDAEGRQRALTSLAPLLVHTGEAERAREAFDQLRALGPLSPSLRISHAQLLRTQGDIADAFAEVDAVIRDEGATAESLRLRGILRLDQGDAAAAVEDLKESVRQNPYDIGAQHKLGQAYQQLGQPAAAKPHLDKSQELTQATYRIGELEDELRRHPNDAAKTQELQRLRKLVGR